MARTTQQLSPVKKRLSMAFVAIFALLVQSLYIPVGAHHANAVSMSPLGTEIACQDAKAIITLTTRQAQLPDVPQGARNWYASAIYKTESYGTKSQSLSLGDTDTWVIATNKYQISAEPASVQVVGGYTISENITVLGQKIGSWDKPYVYNKTLSTTIAETKCDTTDPDIEVRLSKTMISTSDSSNPFVKITAADAESGVANVQYKVSPKDDMTLVSIDWTDVSNGVSSEVVGANTLQDGRYVLIARASDAVGNESLDQSAEFTVDTIAPKATILSPLDGAAVRGIVALQGEVQDDNPMNSFFYITGPDGYAKSSLATNGRTLHEYLWDTTGLPEGEYTIYFETRDVADNKEGSRAHPGKSVAKIIVMVDTTPPVLTILSPANDQQFLTTDPITVETFVDNSAVRVVMNIDGVDGTEQEDTTLGDGNLSSFFEIPAGTLGAGTYQVIVKAYDAAGNETVTYVTLIVTEPEEVVGPSNPGTLPGSANSVNDGERAEDAGSEGELPETAPSQLGIVAQLPISSVISGDGEQVATGTGNGVLGEEVGETGTPLEDTDVLGATDNKLLGLVWYWWLIILVALIGGWLLLAAAIRRSRAEEQVNL